MPLKKVCRPLGLFDWLMQIITCSCRTRRMCSAKCEPSSHLWGSRRTPVGYVCTFALSIAPVETEIADPAGVQQKAGHSPLRITHETNRPQRTRESVPRARHENGWCVL